MFRITYHVDGTISRYKARLVAKGFHQTLKVDYNEASSLVVKALKVRIVLSITVMHKWVIRQVDVNNAFLNGILVEEEYMAQPEGFVNPCKPQHIYKLKSFVWPKVSTKGLI